MGISFEKINRRLGYNFLEAEEKHWEKIDSEYDGKRPTDDLNEAEREFYLKYLLSDKREDI